MGTAARPDIADLYVVKDGVLGSGKFSTVYQGTAKICGKQVAIKISKPSAYEAIVDMARTQKAEMTALGALRHSEYVVGLLDVCVDSSAPSVGQILVMELGEATLEQCLNPELPHHFVQDEQDAKEYTRQLISGLAAIHAADIVHRDIKPANVLVTHDRRGGWRLMYCDFGSSSTGQEDQPNGVRGTIHYNAPDQYLDNQVTLRSDVWNLAMVIARFWRKDCKKLITPPLGGTRGMARYREHIKSIVAVFGNIDTQSYPGVETLPYYHLFKSACTSGKAESILATHLKVKSYARPDLAIPDSGFDLLKRMLQYDPNERISATNALQHPYFKERSAGA